MIGLLLTWIAGFEGMPIPYSPKLDDGITILLLCCFFISAYVLSRSRKFLVQLVKDFLLNRERTSIFAATTAADMRYMLLLILQTCVLGAVCTFNYFIDVRPELVERIPPYILLGVYLAMALLYLFWKWVTYSFLGWIFFTETVQVFGWSLILHCFITLDSPFSHLFCSLFTSIWIYLQL